MELTEERLAGLMAYCRVDELDPDAELLPGLFVGAVEQMRIAGVKPPRTELRRALYDLCVNALVLDALDNRGAQTAGYVLSANPAFRDAMEQLKRSEPIRKMVAP